MTWSHDAEVVADGRYVVDIRDDDADGNRETDVPTIAIFRDGTQQLNLTWAEADQLAAALTAVTTVARNG